MPSRNRPRRVEGNEHALSPGCYESPEEKAAMRKQIARGLLTWRGVSQKLPAQPTPLRSEARPADPNDLAARRSGGLLEERMSGLSNEE